MDQLEREERDLEERLACGEISNMEFNREMNELYRDYRGAAREAAQRAYDEEYDRW